MVEGDKAAELELWDRSIAEIRRFVDDFIAYVVFSQKGIRWTRKKPHPASGARFSRDVGDFIMYCSERIRASNAPKLRELYERDDFDLSEFPKIFSKCLTASYRSGKDDFFMQAIFNWFGYCAEVALAFYRVINGQGIQMAADLLSDRLIHLVLPLFIRLVPKRTLVQCIISERVICAESICDVYEFEVDCQSEDSEDVSLTTEDHVRRHLESELDPEGLETLKERWAEEVKEEQEIKESQERERRRQEFARTNPQNSTLYKTLVKHTWEFVDGFISDVMKEVSKEWKRGKRIKRKHYTTEVGQRIRYLTKEVRKIYSQNIEQVLTNQNINDYPQMFLAFAVRLLQPDNGRPNYMRLNNLFAYAAAAAAFFQDTLPNGPDIVANTLGRFIIGYIVPTMMDTDGYKSYVDFINREFVVQSKSEENRLQVLTIREGKSFPLPR